MHRIWDLKWYGSLEKSGTALLTAGCHAVDALRWFARSRVEEVSAYQVKTENPAEYPGTISINLKFEDGKIGRSYTTFEAQKVHSATMNFLPRNFSRAKTILCRFPVSFRTVAMLGIIPFKVKCHIFSTALSTTKSRFPTSMMRHRHRRYALRLTSPQNPAGRFLSANSKTCFDLSC